MVDISQELSSANNDVLDEIIRQAETYLQTQLTASIAADQRAIGFTSLMAAAAMAIGAAGSALILGTPPQPNLGWVCIFVAVGLLASMFFAIKAAMPAQFWFAGNSPEQWLNDVKIGLTLKASKAQQASHYAEMIAYNNDLMARNNKQMSVAVWIAWWVLLGGGAIAVLALLGLF